MADLMSWPKIIAIHCEKLNAQVNVTVYPSGNPTGIILISRISGLTIVLAVRNIRILSPGLCRSCC